MPVGKTLLIASLLLFTLFSGCTFLHQTHFSLLSLVVDDDEGFPRMVVQFNTSDTSHLIFTDPSHTVLFSETYYAGIHNESMYFSGYRTTVPAGMYQLTAKDSSQHTIFEDEVSFNGANLSITSLSIDGWNSILGSPSVAFHLSLTNTGDLPAYPSRVTIQQGSFTQDVLLLPEVILPSTAQSLTCFIPLLPATDEDNTLTLSLFDSNGMMLSQTNLSLVKKTPVESWEYTWYYFGSHTLKIPQVDWFSDYYRGLERFDFVDYAAYVFDPYDDLYLEFLVDRILLLKEVRSDVEKINFVASFVQSIEYKNDDPENDSYEYPRYPLETLHDKQGDCEDKAILTAALLQSLGYNVSLLRLPHHMAVGVHLNQTIPPYSYYIDQYYFLETTTLHMTVGKVPPEYEGLTNISVYPLTPRPLLVHRWKDATRYKVSTGADYVTVRMIVENFGTEPTGSIEIRGAFYDNTSRIYNQQMMIVSALSAGEKRVVELAVDVPVEISTTLKTQLFIDNIMVHQRESTSQFP
jgi:predicted transglutaminase-like cysteine proteinase